MEEFAALLRRWRERAGLSQNALARRMGVNPAYVNRLEHGGRGASNRALVEAAAAALGLSPAERDALLAAAGHWPAALTALGPADPSLRLVADLLTDPALSARDKALFRLHLRLAALPWRPLQDGEVQQLRAALDNLPQAP
ncbi:MAG TPA: helix-turn-helix transcriptional regulator [Chloroflexota bacterium]|nr:helix-turn-helix transcriptional regulator [Chloroflexota bacterium]